MLDGYKRSGPFLNLAQERPTFETTYPKGIKAIKFRD